MNIVIIGSGNVAWNLAKLFYQHGHEIVQIVSRNAATATKLAYEVNTESTSYFSVLNRTADLYVIAVQDASIPDVARELKDINGTVVHTSGVLGSAVLADCSSKFGVLYPLQSLVGGATKVPNISFIINGNTPETELFLHSFVASLKQSGVTINSDEKAALHVAAVLVNNFVNHLYVLAADWCMKNNIEFKLLLPLIVETSERLAAQQLGSNAAYLKALKSAQTGPAVRNDKATIAEHESLLQNEEELLKLYTLFTSSIKKV
jgi:predicted short-subunit dehydrogenase-like oxidoreductase (DUF2520 family)